MATKKEVAERFGITEQQVNDLLGRHWITFATTSAFFLPSHRTVMVPAGLGNSG